MKHIYYVEDDRRVTPVLLSSDKCLQLAKRLPVNLLLKDIAEWRDKAKPGDVFVIDASKKLVVLDFETQSPVPGPTRLSNLVPSIGGNK